MYIYINILYIYIYIYIYVFHGTNLMLADQEKTLAVLNSSEAPMDEPWMMILHELAHL